jgi:hypothetical protein
MLVSESSEQLQRICDREIAVIRSAVSKAESVVEHSIRFSDSLVRTQCICPEKRLQSEALRAKAETALARSLKIIGRQCRRLRTVYQGVQMPDGPIQRSVKSASDVRPKSVEYPKALVSAQWPQSRTQVQTVPKRKRAKADGDKKAPTVRRRPGSAPLSPIRQSTSMPALRRPKSASLEILGRIVQGNDTNLDRVDIKGESNPSPYDEDDFEDVNEDGDESVSGVDSGDSDFQDEGVASVEGDGSLNEELDDENFKGSDKEEYYADIGYGDQDQDRDQDQDAEPMQSGKYDPDASFGLRPVEHARGSNGAPVPDARKTAKKLKRHKKRRKRILSAEKMALVQSVSHLLPQRGRVKCCGCSRYFSAPGTETCPVTCMLASYPW